MTDEEYFRKNHPDFCYGTNPLSPYWDLFQDGVEFGERQSEKKIAELEKENRELKSLTDFQIWSNIDNYSILKKSKEQLNKAVELLKWALHSDPEHDNLVDFDTKWKEAEQFLKEIEK